MTTLEYQAPQPKAEAKSKGTVFHYDGSAKSPYLTPEGQPATWQQVQDTVAGIMKEKKFTWSSVSQMQKLLPALIFALANEIDELQAQLVTKKGKQS